MLTLTDILSSASCIATRERNDCALINMGSRSLSRSSQRDEGTSSFKTKEETESSRDKYVSVLSVLLAGSFIIPMVQYWWYIRDDDRPIN